MDDIKGIIQIDNNEDVELQDLTKLLNAFEDEYQYFLKENQLNLEKFKTKLVVKEVRKKCLLFEVAPIIINCLYSNYNLDTICQFMSYLANLLSNIKNNDNEKLISKRSYKNVKDIVEATAKDNGSNLILNAQSGANVTINYNLPNTDAKAIKENCEQHIEEIEEIKSEQYEKELLYLYQARNENKIGGNGDKGVIEKISNKPKKLIYSSIELKNDLINISNNIFNVYYVLDVESVIAENRIVAYKILKFHSCFEKE